MNIEALKQINAILKNKCAPCETRKQMERDYGSKGQYARVDGYCNRECPVGKELQDLGKQLIIRTPARETLPRKQRRAINQCVEVET